MINIIKFKFQNKIISKDKNFIQLAIYKLIYLEKAKRVRYKNVKKSIEMGTLKLVQK